MSDKNSKTESQEMRLRRIEAATAEVRRDFKSRLDQFDESNTTPVELHILRRLDVGEQKMNAMINLMVEVKEQTVLTNGRVGRQERVVERHAEVIDKGARTRAVLLRLSKATLSLLCAVTVVIVSSFVAKWLHLVKP